MAQKSTDVSELASAISAIVRKIRASAPSQVRDISWTQRALIVRLDNEGPRTIAELARAEGVKPQSMGTAVGQLEEAGLVERKAHPTDGRQVNIKLTAKGATLRKNTRDAKETWLAQAIAKLDKREQAALFAAGPIIKKLADL